MATTSVVSRENIETWKANSRSLYLFRRAVEEMQKISDAALMDERGYQWVAGVHGGFGGAPYCQHGNLNFLTWHRPYLLDCELKLRDQIKKFASPEEADEWRIPYWRWDDPNVNGIPEAFTAKTYEDGGAIKPNPLFAQPYQLPYDPGSPVPPGTKLTFRTPRALPELKAQGARVRTAMRAKTFTRFSQLLEGPHNSIHVWVSGFMVTFRSSFDPLFWVHHCNIDRQWWEWHNNKGDTSIPVDVKRFQCQPFKFDNISAEAFLDTRVHGYTYAIARNMTTRVEILEQMNALAENRAPEAMTFQAADLRTSAKQSRLHFHGLEHTTETFDIRVFANRKTPPTDSTPLSSKSGFLGSYAILGHGHCPGAPGHCDHSDSTLNADHRQKHHLSPFDVTIDITNGILRLATVRKQKKKTGKKKKTIQGAGKVTVWIVVVNAEGKQVPHDVIEFDNISLTTH